VLDVGSDKVVGRSVDGASGDFECARSSTAALETSEIELGWTAFALRITKAERARLPSWNREEIRRTLLPFMLARRIFQ
jgi:hypothetical protein